MTTNIVSTLTIRISERLGSYYIEASGLGADVRSLPFTWNPTKDEDEAISLLHSDPAKVSEEQLVALGQTLYKSVFTPEILMAYHQRNRKLKSGDGIRIRLIIEAKNLSHIPWEVMHDGQDFISLYSEYPLVRGMRESFHVRQSAVSGPIRILYVWSEPKDLPPLNLNSPAEEIKRLVSHNKRIKFDILPDATVISLRKALLSQYHIVCFAGHGDEKHIYFETVTGHDKLSAKELARELEGRPVQLVFLVACKTAGTLTEGLASFAQTLANETQIPAIAAMQYEISDDQANLLAARYFETIANFRPLDVALAESRKALLKEKKVLRDVFAPVIYLQSKTSNLFQRARNWLAISFSIIAFIAIVLAAMFGRQVQSSLIELGFANSTARAEATRAEAEAITRATAQALAESEGIARATAETEAKQKKIIARAVELAGFAASARENQLDLSLLLAIEAYRTFDNAQTRGTLLDSLQANPHLLRYINNADPDVFTITVAAFSPDGTTLASASVGKLILMDTETNQITGQLYLDGSSLPRSLVFSPDGKILASGDADGTISLWELNKSQNARILTGHTDTVGSLAFSPDGKILASGSLDRSIILWDVEKLKPFKKLTAQYLVSGITFSPDGKILVSKVLSDIVLWDMTTYTPISEPLKGNGSVDNILTNNIAISSDGRTLAVGGNNVTLWNLPLLLSHISLSKLGLGEYSIESDSKTLAGYTSEVTAVAFSPNGNTLITGTADGDITMWDGLWNPEPVSQSLSANTSAIVSLSFNSNGRTFASISRFSTTVLLWDIESYQPLSSMLSELTSIRFSSIFDIQAQSDHKLIVYRDNERGSIRLWDFTTDKYINKISQNDTGIEYNSLAINPDGTIFASGDSEGIITLWDTDTLKPIYQIKTENNNWINSLVFSPNGKILASGDIDGNVILWDVTTLEKIEQLPNIDLYNIVKMIFSPNGKNLVINDWGSIVLWDIDTHQYINQPISGEYGACLAFSPNGEIFVTCSSVEQTSNKTTGSVFVGVIHLWNTENFQLIGQLINENVGTINDIVFSKDGKVLFSSSSSLQDSIGDRVGNDYGDILFWDIQTLQPIGQPLTVKKYSRFERLAVSQDGNFLFSVGDELISWEINPIAWIEIACRHAGRNFTKAEWSQYFPNETYRVTCPNEPILE